MNILEKIAKDRKDLVDFKKSIFPLKNLMNLAEKEKIGDFEFKKALEKKGLSFICECKKASPSKGIIDKEFKYLDIALEYEKAGADAISVLTENKYFLGKDEYLKDIATNVSIPCLRKDFIIDEYMIYEAKILKASAILLIVSLLNKEQLCEYIDIANSLGLSALVEVHNKRELDLALNNKAEIIGVNNRNLKDFSVDNTNTKNLKSFVPNDIIFVSESGIKTREDVRELQKLGVDAVLVGETMMKAKDKTKMLLQLRGYND